MVATTVLSSAVTETDADVAIIAVSGLSFYYSSVVVTVPFSAAMAVDVITSAADANFSAYTQKGVQMHSFLILLQFSHLYSKSLLHFLNRIYFYEHFISSFFIAQSLP